MGYSSKAVSDRVSPEEARQSNTNQQPSITIPKFVKLIHIWNPGKRLITKILCLLKVKGNQVVNRCNVSELIKVTIFQYKQNYKTKKMTFAVSSITAKNVVRLVRSGVAKWFGKG